MSSSVNLQSPALSTASPAAASVPVASKKQGILSHGELKAVRHLNDFITGKENGTAFLQSHKVIAFMVRQFTRLVALTGIGYLAMDGSAVLVDFIDNKRAESKNKKYY